MPIKKNQTKKTIKLKESKESLGSGIEVQGIKKVMGVLIPTRWNANLQ